MWKKIKLFLGIPVVEYVDNTEQKYPWLESDEFLMVLKKNHKPLLFTISRVKEAEIVAGKNPEDLI